ncbi:uncharacterized protein MCAP_0864-like [Watersipora subatra]|uniref:uncharacterized protein MCAP_0864-like n=1 Tax=Watersipora subatra TaxID=2589382 RepID=UPI00355C886B
MVVTGSYERSREVREVTGSTRGYRSIKAWGDWERVLLYIKRIVNHKMANKEHEFKEFLVKYTDENNKFNKRDSQQWIQVLGNISPKELSSNDKFQMLKNTLNANNQTALHCAAKKNDQPFFNILLKDQTRDNVTDLMEITDKEGRRVCDMNIIFVERKKKSWMFNRQKISVKVVDKKEKLTHLKKLRDDKSVQIRNLIKERADICEEIAGLEKTRKEQDEIKRSTLESKIRWLEKSKQQTKNELKDTKDKRTQTDVVFKSCYKNGTISAEAIELFCPGAQGKGVPNHDQLANRYHVLFAFYSTKIEELQQRLTNIEADLKTATQNLDQFDKNNPQYKKLQQLHADLYRVETEIATVRHVAQDLWSYTVTAVLLNHYRDLEKEYSFMVEAIAEKKKLENEIADLQSQLFKLQQEFELKPLDEKRDQHTLRELRKQIRDLQGLILEKEMDRKRKPLFKPKPHLPNNVPK